MGLYGAHVYCNEGTCIPIASVYLFLKHCCAPQNTHETITPLFKAAQHISDALKNLTFISRTNKLQLEQIALSTACSAKVKEAKCQTNYLSKRICFFVSSKFSQIFTHEVKYSRQLMDATCLCICTIRFMFEMLAPVRRLSSLCRKITHISGKTVQSAVT